jgi:ssDNA-binding Zn-finger/Zn-ribbon topoisomerase 1
MRKQTMTFVCDKCGKEEAVTKGAGRPKLPREWADLPYERDLCPDCMDAYKLVMEEVTKLKTDFWGTDNVY